MNHLKYLFWRNGDDITEIEYDKTIIKILDNITKKIINLSEINFLMKYGAYSGIVTLVMLGLENGGDIHIDNDYIFRMSLLHSGNEYGGKIFHLNMFRLLFFYEYEYYRDKYFLKTIDGVHIITTLIYLLSNCGLDYPEHFEFHDETHTNLIYDLFIFSCENDIRVVNIIYYGDLYFDCFFRSFTDEKIIQLLKYSPDFVNNVYAKYYNCQLVQSIMHEKFNIFVIFQELLGEPQRNNFFKTIHEIKNVDNQIKIFCENNLIKN